MLAGVSGGIALALDVEMGFLDRLIAAPIPRWAMVVGRLAGTAALGVLSAVWFLLGGLLFGAEVRAGLVGVLVVLVLAPLSALGFGGIGAALALWSGRASVVQGIFPLVFVILFMSSAFFPRELLLEPAATLADWNPLSYMAEGLRDPVVSELSAGPLLRGLAGVGLLGAFSAAVCALALRARLRAG
jgi:ABC-2 type transport system permease protein